MEIENRLLTTKQAAKYLAVSEKTIYNLSKTQDLPSIRFGHTRRYDLQDLNSFIQRLKK